MGSACVCQNIGGASEVQDLDDSDESLQKAREYAELRDYSQSVQFYNEALRLRVKYFGLDENTEISLKRRKSKVLERRLSAVKVAIVFSKMLNGRRKVGPSEGDEEEAGGSQTPPPPPTTAGDEDHVGNTTPNDGMSQATPPLSVRRTEHPSALKYAASDPSSRHDDAPPAARGAPKSAIEFLKNKSAFLTKSKPPGVAKLDVVKRVIGSSTLDASEYVDVSEADILLSVPYHFSHVQLLVEIGNFHLSFNRIHYAFFYFVQTLSIVAPIVRSKKPPEDVGSALLLYVDAALGLCIVYINCMKPDAFQKMQLPSEEDEGSSVNEMFQLPRATMHRLSLAPSPTKGAALAKSSSSPVSSKSAERQTSVESPVGGTTAIIAAASGGMNATALVRNSVSKMIKLLDGSHPLDLAERQAQTAIQRVQEVDGPRSSLLVALMHVKCHVLLHRGHKRQALHTMQRALGMTYCRSGASDALKLSLYSHHVLDYIKAEIRKEDQAVAGASDLCSPMQRGDSLVAEHALASSVLAAGNNARTAHEDEQLQLLQRHLPPSSGSANDFTDIKRVSSIRFERNNTTDQFESMNDSLLARSATADPTASTTPADDDCDLWFSGCKRVNSDAAAASSPQRQAWGGDDSTVNDDRMIRQIVGFLQALGHAATASCGATPSQSPPLAKHGSMSESSGRGLSFQSTSSAQAALAGFGKPPIPQNFSIPQIAPPNPQPPQETAHPGQVIDDGGAAGPRRLGAGGEQHHQHATTPPPSLSRRSVTIQSSEDRTIEGSSNSLTNNAANSSGLFQPRSPHREGLVLAQKEMIEEPPPLATKSGEEDEKELLLASEKRQRPSAASESETECTVVS